MLFSVPSQLGYGALFGFVAAESAGLPVPGETALIAAGLLSVSGHLSLPIVIGVGAVAAIIGDNFGYVLGRRGGRSILTRGGFLAGHRRKAVARGDQFFARHGAKTVFFGRWISGVRVVAAVLAGASEMPWRKFLLYNALGALAWSAGVAGISAAFGPIGAAVLYGGGFAIAGGAATVGAIKGWRRKRREVAADPQAAL